jgi:hypothetical protein
MINSVLSLLLLMATGLGSTAVVAQTVYRCGDTYSQIPCAGGSKVDAADERTRSQKSQTDASAQRDARSAKSLEATRIQQEEAQAKALRASPAKSEKTDDSKKTGTSGTTTQPHKKDAYFTARLPNETRENRKSQKEKAATKPEQTEPGK